MYDRYQRRVIEKRPNRQYAVGLPAEQADRLDELIRTSGLTTSGCIAMLLVEAMAHVTVGYEEVVQQVPTLIWQVPTLGQFKAALEGAKTNGES